jgi:hypothetical protein
MRISSCIDDGPTLSTPITSSAIASKTVPQNTSATPQAIVTASRALTTMPRILIPRPEMVNTSDYIFDTVWGLIVEIHTREPTHPMFGEPQQDQLRAPFNVAGNDTSWYSRTLRFAGCVQKAMGSEMIPGSCWMSSTRRTSIKQNVHAKTSETFFSVAFTRFFFFLANPTSQNWDILTGQKRGLAIDPRQHPFSQTCHNGRHAKADIRDALLDSSCVNGVQHGHFGTSQSNSDVKICKARSRAECPGHGSPTAYCIYVHRNGQLKHCLNLLVTPSSCNCSTKCF